MANLIKTTFEEVWYTSKERFSDARLREIIGGEYVITESKGKVVVTAKRQDGAPNYRASQRYGRPIRGNVLVCKKSQII